MTAEKVMLHWIKVVPDDALTAEGEWIELSPPVESPARHPDWWQVTTKMLEPRVPKGHHIVGFANEEQKRWLAGA